MAELPPVVREFASYKTAIQGCSPRTVEEYCLDLRTFLRYITARRAVWPVTEDAMNDADVSGVTLDDVAAITTADVLEFMQFVNNDRGNGACARARKLSAIRAFYKWLTQKSEHRAAIPINPAANIDTPKKKQTLPKHLTLDESLDLLEAVKNDPLSKTKERDYAIITLFLNTGMRLSELVGISFPDIDRDLRSLRVVGKGNKERIIYLNDACRSALGAYFPIRNAQPAKQKGESALFLSSRGTRISVKTVQWLVGKYLGEAGLEYKKFSTHKLRHTAATLMYQTGQVDVRVLKEILGHEQLNTTQIYTHVSNEGMEQAVAANPLAHVGASGAQGSTPKIKRRTPRKDTGSEK